MSKLNDFSFITYLCDFDIICLIETFMPVDNLTESIFPDYIKFFSPAIRLSDAGRCSGGIYVLVKNNLNAILVNLPVVIDNMIAIEIKNLSKKILLISTYVPPQGSSYYNDILIKNGIDILEQAVSSLLCKFKNYSIIVCGDFNARTANVQPLLQDDKLDFYINNDFSSILNVSSSLSRNSEDSFINKFGRSLIELCISLNFFIINGMSKGDNQGLFTYVSTHGNSVNDYFLVSDDLLSFVDSNVHLEIDSWHLPVSLTLSLNTSDELATSIPENIKKIKWNVNKCINFKTLFMSSFNVSRANLINEIPQNVNQTVQKFSAMFTESAQSMEISVNYNSNSYYKMWFDMECKNFKLQVRRSLHNYTNKRSNVNKENYIQLRKQYKDLINRKKTLFNERRASVLCDSITNSSSFWKEIKHIMNPPKNVCNITLNEWFMYFKDIFHSSTRSNPPICEEPHSDSIIDTNNEYLAELNEEIQVLEVTNAIDKLKAKKSPGLDGVLNEMLQISGNEIASFLQILFNHIFQTGDFPIEWSKSIIISVHKKGNSNICDNYRPISLTSLVSKVFTYILNERLTSYVESLGIVSEEQAGFRRGYSTIDNMYTLYAMIFKQFSKNKKLYVAFIDFRKCFDTINRDALFIILEKNGITGNFLTTLKGMYRNICAAVRNNGELSEFFNCPIGLKQGCLMSPKLFSIFATELSRYLNSQGRHGIQLNPGAQEIHHLLFADDMAIVSDTVVGLQSKLNILHEQCLRLGIEINLEKTKIVAFRKGGHLSRHECWKFGDSIIDVENSYRYLGIDFSTRLSFSTSTAALISKAKQSTNLILRSLYDIECHNLKIFSKLFDSKIQPILSYGSEIWGFHESSNSEVERAHTIAFKRFLSISVHTSNSVLYGDTGRYPLSIIHKVKCIKYWFKIQEMHSSRFPRQAYNMLERLHDNGTTTWVTNIKETLCTNGFGYVWLFKQVENVKFLCKSLKDRLHSNFIQNLNSKLEISSHFQSYNSFKTLFSTQNFLSDKTFSRELRNILIRFRLGVSQLHGHRYKFSPDPRKRTCPICDMANEDEYHMLFVCDVYENCRLKYLPPHLQGRAQLADLLSNQRDARPVAIFLYHAFKLRRLILECIG